MSDESPREGEPSELAEQPRCSAKGCREDATIELRWRNPRLHDAARVKLWLACSAHADHLGDFLSRRGFLLGRAPLSPVPGC